MVKKARFFEFVLFCYVAILSLAPLPAGFFAIFSILVTLSILPFALVKRNNKAALPIFRWFIFILFWALITTTFHDYFVDLRYILLPLLFAILTMLVPFVFSKLAANEAIDVRKHIFTFSAIVTICTLLYALRGYAFAPGFVRLASPIGGSAVIHVALLLTLSVYLANLKVGIKKAASACLVIITIAMIVLTGSRAGLLTMMLLFLSVIINKRNITRSVSMTIFLTGVGYLIYRLLPTGRFANFEDPTRTLVFQNSLHIATNSIENIVFGAGYGTVWPWYAYAAKFLSKSDEFLLSQFGLVLVHPHSVFLGLFTELGLIGLIPFIFIVFTLIKKFLSNTRNGNQFNSVILFGIICTLPSFMMDYYLFANHIVSLIWWYFVFFAVSVNVVQEKHTIK